MANKILRFFREMCSIIGTADTKTSVLYTLAVAASFGKIIRERNLSPADNRMLKKNCLFYYNGLKIILSGQYFDLAREIYCKKSYSLHDIIEIPKNGTVIDLGANVGVFTVLAALHGNRVIAVEGQLGFLKLLEGHLTINECLNKAFTVFGLVGSGTGVFSDRNNIVQASHYSLHPPRLSFSEILFENGIDIIDFLKIDIEGSEFDLFSKDTSWLEMTNVIAMEIHQEFGDVNKIKRVLYENGFETWYVNENGKIVGEILESIGYLFAKKK